MRRTVFAAAVAAVPRWPERPVHDGVDRASSAKTSSNDASFPLKLADYCS